MKPGTCARAHMHVPLVQRARDNEDDVVDHVAVGAIVHELAQRLGGLASRHSSLSARWRGNPAAVRQACRAPGAKAGRARWRASYSSRRPASLCSGPRWWSCAAARARSPGTAHSPCPSARARARGRQAPAGEHRRQAAGRGRCALGARSGAHQVELYVVQRLALAQVVVVRGRQQARAVAAHHAICAHGGRAGRASHHVIARSGGQEAGRHQSGARCTAQPHGRATGLRLLSSAARAKQRGQRGEAPCLHKCAPR